MLVYYYSGGEQNLIAMWYYNKKGKVALWVCPLDGGKVISTARSAYTTLRDRRVCKGPEEEGLCELLEDSGEE